MTRNDRRRIRYEGVLWLLLLLSCTCSVGTMLVSRHLSGIVEVWIDMAPQTLESSWTGQGGLEHKVTTTRIDGESATDFANRHKEAVDALKAVFPPQE